MKAVIPIGIEAVPAAEIYSKVAEGRVHAAVCSDQVAEVIGKSSSAVVITVPERVTAEFLDAIARGWQRGAATGIVCAPIEDLEKLAHIRARQFSDGPRRSEDRFLDFCSENPPAGAEIRVPCRTLAVKAHSDGIALSLKGSYLCPVPFLSFRSEATPPCMRTRACTRLDLQSFDEAAADGSVIDPTTIECDLLILSACNGWTVSGSCMDLRVSLGLSLARAPNVSAIIATHGLLFENFETKQFAHDLLSNLLSGRNLGEALASVNLSTAMQRLGIVFSLFGDPDIRFST